MMLDFNHLHGAMSKQTLLARWVSTIYQSRPFMSGLGTLLSKAGRKEEEHCMLKLGDTRATSQLRQVGLCGVCGLQRDLSFRKFSTPSRTVLLQPQVEVPDAFRLASINLQAVIAALTSLL